MWEKKIMAKQIPCIISMHHWVMARARFNILSSANSIINTYYIPRVHIGYELAITISYPTSVSGTIVLLKKTPKYLKISYNHYEDVKT